MAGKSLTVTDNRTGKTYEIPIDFNTVRASDFRQIKESEDDLLGLMPYAPGMMDVAFKKSSITFIDGERGILRYRGYPIEQLAERSNFLEVAYLLIFGELPTKAQYDWWVNEITHHTFIHENIKKLMDAFPPDAHPMAVLGSTLAALSSFYPEARQVHDPEVRMRQVIRLIAKTPTIVAWAFRRTRGWPYVYPDNDLSYTGNFLSMLFKMTEVKYQPNPVLERALDVLFILHADHEQNCSATAMQTIGSSESDPYMAAAGAVGALYGPLHGGANEAVLKMLREIGSVENIPSYIERVKRREVLLMGFGHRVYKNYDPRARIIRELAHQVFEVTGRNPLLDIAIELEKIALEDEFFVQRKLYPNVDFYSGIIYQAMGFPEEMFTPLFAIGRMPGWCAQWLETIQDPEQKIVRPRQVYVGPELRDFVPMEQRT